MKLARFTLVLLTLTIAPVVLAAADPVRIEVPIQEGGEGVEIFSRIARAYEQARPGVKIDIYADPRIADKLRIRILEKSFPALTNAEFGQWPLIRNGDVFDLAPYLDGPNWEGDDTWRDSFLPGTLDRYSIDGHVYGVPLSYYAQGIWFNKKMFREHGWTPPRTWDELFALCDTIKSAGIAPMAYQGRYTTYAQPIIDSAYCGLTGFDRYRAMKALEPGSFDNDEMRQALAWTQRLATQYFQPGAMGMGHTDAQLQFFLGHCAMIPCGSWLKSEMTGKIPDGFELGTFNFPSPGAGRAKIDPSTLFASSGYYVIFARSPHAREAVDFLRFLTSRKIAAEFCRERDLPVAVRGVNESNLSGDLADLAAMIARSTASYGEAPGGARVEGFELMFQEWNDVLLELLNGRISPEDAAKQLEQRAARVRQLAMDPAAAPVRHVVKPILLLGSLAAASACGIFASMRRRRTRRTPTAANSRTMALRHVVLFVGPALVLFIVFVLYPAIKSFAWSTQQWDGLTQMRWAGLRHFRQLLFVDDGFWVALRNNLFLMIVIPLLVVPLSLFLAARVSRGTRGAKLFRTIFLFPSVMGGVAATLLWMHLYDPQAGVINAALARLGLHGFEGFAWLSQDHLYTALVPMSVWAGFGFNFVLYLAAMEAIPGELYEAAQLDGASPWQQFRTITFPLIWEVLSISTVFMIIGGMKAFETIWLLTDQAPGTQTHVIGTRMIQSMFTEMNIGQATAIAVLLFAMVFAMSVLALRVMRRDAVEM
jgi:raffinose/stachyose/melibiose transport system permease protein